MKAEHLYRYWESRIRGSLELLNRAWKKCVATGDVESIHCLRVCFRRIRLYLQIGKPLLDHEKIDLYREWALEVSAVLGPVRNIDVAVSVLKAMQGTDRLCALLLERRQRMWEDVDFHRKLRRASPLTGALRTAPKQSQMKKVCRRYEKALDEAYAAVKKHYSTRDEDPIERWHEIRRNIRRVRYLREMILTPHKQKSDRLLKSFMELQAVLGNAQNCAETINLLPIRSAVGDVKSIRGILDSQIEQCYDKANQLWMVVDKLERAKQ